MRWPYENIGVTTTRAFRNLLNKIIGDIGADMQEHKDRADNIQAQVDNLVADGDSSPEAAQARVGADGTNYTTLKSRLDAENQRVTAQLADAAIGYDGFDYGTPRIYINTLESNIGKLSNLGTEPRDIVTTLLERQVNIKDFGAVGDDLADNTQIIQDAMDYLREKGGGTLLIPYGKFIIEKLNLYSNVFLIGTSTSSILKCKNNAQTDDFITFADTLQNMLAVKNLFLEGNKANQDHPINGLTINNGNSEGNPFYDHHNLFEHLYIKDFSGNGFNMPRTSRENRIIHVVAVGNEKNGFNLEGTDNVISHCSSVTSGENGFYIHGGNNKFSSCKAFWSGMKDSQNAGDGFFIYASKATQLDTCEAQENGRNGFSIWYPDGNIFGTNLNADTNSKNSSSGVGFYLEGASQCTILGQVLNRAELNGKGHKYAVSIKGDNSFENDINIKANTNDPINKPLKFFDNNGSVNISNKVIINDENLNVKNIFSNPEVIIDSNNDGLGDGFDVPYAIPEADRDKISGDTSIDFKEQAQKISIISNSSISNKASYGIPVFMPISPGRKISAKTMMKVSDPSKVGMYLIINFYNNETYIGQKVSNVVNNVNYETSVVVDAVAPSGSTKAEVKVTLVSMIVGGTGSGWFKCLKFAKS